MTMDLNNRITKSELEAYLWGAAVRLRGLIDAGNYKGYIFPLLFLKRISDVWDEEYEKALQIYQGDFSLSLLHENFTFNIPEGCHWRDIRETTSDVGRKIQNSMREIESKNISSLGGVFGDADWTNKDLLADSMLIDIVEHFSTQDLRLERLPEDELGNGYEYLIKKFADDSGHTAQEFYTNRTLVHLMTTLLNLKPGESIYDPTCGTGGMLISCADEIRRQGFEHRTLKLYGQELNYTTASIAKMNLFLHGIEDGMVAHGDTLSSPSFLDKGAQLQTFDVVLANPPYSIKNWDRESFAKDPFGRNVWGLPPQGRADYAFFQHVACSLNPKTGRAAILFPHGVLFRQEEKEMREQLVKSGLLEAVIGLGPGLFYNAPMESVVVILNKQRTLAERKEIYFINAVNEVTKEQGGTFLSSLNQQKIQNAYSSKVDISGFSRAVKSSEIESNGYSLALPLYVESQYIAQAVPEPELPELIERFQTNSKNALFDLELFLKVQNAKR